METEKAIEYILAMLEYPVWFVHTGNDEDFLRRIDKEAIATIVKELEKKEKMINEIKSKLEEHIQHCKQEAQSSLHNEICHISLKFDESLLNIIEKKVEEVQNK